MIRLSRDGNKIVIHTDMPLRDKENIQRLPGARYALDEHRYEAPLSWATCRSLRGLFGDELDIGQDVIDWARDERVTRIDPAMRMRAATNIDGENGKVYDIVRAWRDLPGYKLYRFQEAGAAFLVHARQALLADLMGTGKTAQTIRAVRALYEMGENPFPMICVVPNNMIRTWDREIREMWWPGLSVGVVKGSALQRRKILAEKHHVYIMNYDGLRSHTRLTGYGDIRLKRCVVCDSTLPDIRENQQSRCENCKKELNKITWKTIIVDEAHKMQNPKSKQTRALWSLHTEGTDFVFCLTGTPIGDVPTQLWPGLHLISKKEWPSKGRYVDRYCATALSYAGLTVTGLRADTREEFYDIVYPRMRRMPKEVVLPDLPKKTYIERFVEMSTKQAKAYKQMIDLEMAMLDDGSIIVAQNPLVRLTRLTQFSSAYAELQQNEQTGELNVVLTDPSNKVDEMIEILAEMGDEPAVVFAKSRQLIEIARQRLMKEGISFSMIVGGQSPDEREAEKMRFQEGLKRVCLCTYGAGGIGITLTRAGTMIRLERSWSMVEHTQAEDRVHRIGSEIHDKIMIVDIISSGTVEERQLSVLAGKDDRLQEVVQDEKMLRYVLGLED